MPFWFFNALMLFGLIAVAIPPVIHLLTRKRFDVVEWGAMRFLKVSDRTRRKIFLEELLLMLLRMGLIAIFVLALAAPFLTSKRLAKIGGRGNRDIVIIFDGSYSMGFIDKGVSAHQSAKDWAVQFLDEMAPGDSVAIIQAKQQVIPVLGTLTTDANQVRTAIENLTPPRGGVDWPAAVQLASQILNESQRAQREVIILTDGQRFGWADDSSLLRWELLSNRMSAEAAFKPRLWVVNMDPNRPQDPANWSLNPLRTTRAVAAAGREITFRTTLQLSGSQEIALPDHVYLEIDGRPAGEIKLPVGAVLDKGQIPLTFKHRFPNPGSHLVTLRIDNDALPAIIAKISLSKCCRSCQCCWWTAMTAPARKSVALISCATRLHQPAMRIRPFWPASFRFRASMRRRSPAIAATSPAPRRAFLFCRTSPNFRRNSRKPWKIFSAIAVAC